MISHRMRENRRVRALKLPKNIERLYKEGKCRECAVVVTRMDFAKILGKFTKVKIQYENSSPNTKKNSEVTSPNSNARLKSNENGMVLIHRNAYNQHPVKELLTTNKKPKANQSATPRQANNVLKENNRLKKTPLLKDKNANINISSSNVNKRQNNSIKQYGIIFIDPSSTKNDVKSKISLANLLPMVDKSILPTEEWCIDYMPRSVEPMNDKVYDRIAAELEDLMCNEPVKPDEKPNVTDSKVDEFPSIMDILNDNTSDSSKANDQSDSVVFKPNLESSDVEAMLLGKAAPPNKELAHMEVDNTDMSNLIEDVAQLNAVVAPVVSIPEIQQPVIDTFDNPHSPSILDEALQKGIEEHLPCNPSQHKDETKTDIMTPEVNVGEDTKEKSPSPVKSGKLETATKLEQKSCLPTNITHLIFKKNVDGKCVKSVTCPKNLKYSIELDGKSVEFLGAPKVISSLEDLQVLLQIVNETELQNVYVTRIVSACFK